MWHLVAAVAEQKNDPPPSTTNKINKYKNETERTRWNQTQHNQTKQKQKRLGNEPETDAPEREPTLRAANEGEREMVFLC